MSELIHDTQACKLGRKALKADTRTLRMGAYLKVGAEFVPPISVDWTKGVKDFGIMLNNQLGCCTIAGIGHAIQTWSLNVGKEITVADSVILEYYEKFDGYNPSDPNTDQGGIELDVLNDWKKQGFSGHVLDAFAFMNPKNIIGVKQAIALFGGLYIGLALPLTAQYQQIWDFDGSNPQTSLPDSWGGHCVYITGYDENHLTCITWGQTKQMTYSFWNNYCDEAYALVSQDFLNNSGVDPNGFNKGQLMEDLEKIK